MRANSGLSWLHNLKEQINRFFRLVKFEHTIFALPFAYLGMILAAKAWPTWWQIFWITVAMVAARTLAMTINRIVDWRYDARNPRTAGREIPRGIVRPQTAWRYAGIALLLFLFSAAMLNRLVLYLSPIAILFLVGYSFSKRVTWLSHWLLGLTDSIAPAGAWIAVRPELSDPVMYWLMLAVLFWIAGFDLIYACQDSDFDRQMGLHALPARFGNRTAMWVARCSHLITLAALVMVGISARLLWPYWVGLLLVTGGLAYEHVLVKPNDLTHIDLAFFTMNGYISIVIFLATLSALILQYNIL